MAADKLPWAPVPCIEGAAHQATVPGLGGAAGAPALDTQAPPGKTARASSPGMDAACGLQKPFPWEPSSLPPVFTVHTDFLEALGKSFTTSGFVDLY